MQAACLPACLPLNARAKAKAKCSVGSIDSGEGLSVCLSICRPVPTAKGVAPPMGVEPSKLARSRRQSIPVQCRRSSCPARSLAACVHFLRPLLRILPTPIFDKFPASDVLIAVVRFAAPLLSFFLSFLPSRSLHSAADNSVPLLLVRRIRNQMYNVT